MAASARILNRRTVHFIHLMDRLYRLPRALMLVLTIGVFALIAALDYVTGTFLSMSLVYCLPVSMAAWRLGRSAGVMLGISSAVALVVLNPRDVGAHSVTLSLLWNVLNIGCMFALVALLVMKVSRLLEKERNLARTDFLTGTRNLRSFVEESDQEILRALRQGQSLSLIYLDLDGFKEINDRLGHREGDRLLKTVGRTLLQTVRSIDSVARLGGDEFVVLLPNTDSEAAAIVAPRLRQALLARMRQKRWPVTFSIGVLTCSIPPDSAEQLIHRADEVMYLAKQAGKDQIVYSLQGA